MSIEKCAPLWRNAVTLIGAFLAGVSALFILSLLLLDLTSAQPSPYLGLFTFLILPGFVAVGAALIVLGVWLTRRRLGTRPGLVEPFHYYPQIDLNLPRHRRVLVTAGAMALLAIPLIGVLSYEGYHYTDSNEFCGLVCHEVMAPQYTAYQHSPHASVSCAECHIGSGASWYVKSKLSGVRQVLAVAGNAFPRPIPPAIQALRPATETCRQCHWPAKFFGEQLVTIRHFAPDEANTSHEQRMLLKTGGSDRSTGPPSGIHWHMTLGFTIEYVAVDDDLQDIPWVRTIDDTTGDERIYRSDGLPVDAPPPSGTLRVVDCMDCHNRPTHNFRSPDRSVDVALNVDPSLQTLPFSKREAVSALVRPYQTKADGMAGVAEALTRFYREQRPEVWKTRRTDVERLKEAAVEIYRTGFFPEMNVDWRTYPDNIGHKIFPGCFRCHDGAHVDSENTPISHECVVCHEFLPLRIVDETPPLNQTAGFVHPMPLQGVHARIRCDQCHDGGVGPPRRCESCHDRQHEFRAGTLAAFASLAPPQDPMFETVTCDGCHDLSEPTDIEAIDSNCMDCHEDEESRFEGMLASWKREVEMLMRDAQVRTDDAGRQLLQTLRDAGPLHNIDATRIIIRSLTDEPNPAGIQGR